jgi:hypothetical protein
MSRHYSRDAFDGTHYRHGAATAPADLVRIYNSAAAPVGIFPLMRGGYAVIAVAHEPRYSLHPLIVVTREGAHMAVPERGLGPSDSPGFITEIMTDRPLRTRADAITTAQRWVTDACDGLPTDRLSERGTASTDRTVSLGSIRSENSVAKRLDLEVHEFGHQLEED